MYEDAHLEAEYEDRNGGEIDLYDYDDGPMFDDDGCESHVWVAGMCYVHDEDLTYVATERAQRGETVKCENCDHVATEGIDF